ncbi:Suppressor of nda4 [Hyphodiscus hymeniophilus]|uniref:Suppressor of nda4 n=1 Tax=Hyphodiscus hymeniophilus TaxID=353542 RepID=A0A9P6VKT1_9HELO|nr:Suppressor of nda4 [Hyphodiscus hymeniophilus]
MYLPRSLLSTLYLHLQRTHHPLSPPVLILVALEPDALCGCRILTRLLKRDYIPHKIQPIAGYGDLEKAGRNVIRPMMESQGGSGGVVVCLGVGGLVDLGGLLGIDAEGDESSYGGVEVWVIDARRPWNLGNVFGGIPVLPPVEEDGELINQTHLGVDGGKIQRGYKPNKGGIIVFDDGDIEEELDAERDAYLALVDMPEVEENEDDSDGSETESEDEEAIPTDSRPGQKRKSWSDRDGEDESSDDDDRPRQRRRSNSSSPIPDSPSRPPKRGLMSISGPSAVASSASRSVSPTPAQPPRQPSARTLRRRLLKLRRKNESVLQAYYSLGASYSEPISSMMYSLASELGREDNDLLWMTIVGVTSMELYGRSTVGVAISTQKSSSPSSGWMGTRGSRIRQLLRDEVRRLNPPELSDSGYSSNRSLLPENNGIIPTTARSPTDTSIRLSPEPKFLLIRHWSLYDSMLHSPYLSARLHIWSDVGRKRLNKLLARMGISLVQCKQSYTHMDMELKRGLRSQLLKYSDMYGLDDLVPAADTDGKDRGGMKEGWGFVRSWGWRATLSAQDVGVVVGAILEVGKKAVASLENGGYDRREAKETTDEDGTLEGEEWVGRFWAAYDALENIEDLKAALPTAQHLHRAILRTGTSIIEKRQIRHLRAFRMCVVKDGPDVALFTHPAALTKLALWIGEAIAEQERESKGKLGHGGRGTPLVVAGLNDSRGVYVVVGTGGGGGGSMGFGDRGAAKEKKEKREAKLKAKELKHKNKELIREQKREARRAAAGDDADEEDDETESEASESDSSEDDGDEDDEKEHVKGFGRNKFGNAFQEVVEETNARVRIDSFEHCVVEVKKEDLAGFLESLSMKAVVG